MKICPASAGCSPRTCATAPARTKSPWSGTRPGGVLAGRRGQTFTASAEPVAVDGPQAVVRVQVAYGDPIEQEYRDLWLLRFADDGRVDDFEEWAYWPGKPYSAGNG